MKASSPPLNAAVPARLSHARAAFALALLLGLQPISTDIAFWGLASSAVGWTLVQRAGR